MKLIKLQDIASNEKNAIVDGPFGSSLKTSDYVPEGVPVLQGKNITGDKFSFFDIRFITEKKAEELSRSKVQVGDYLLVKIGSIGYLARIDSLKQYKSAIIPANLAKIKIDETKVYPAYFEQVFKQNYIKDKLRNISSKTAQPALSLGKIKSFEIPIPDEFEDQIHIATILSKAEALIQQRKDSIRLLDEFLKSTFLEMFGKLDKQKTKEYLINELKSGGNETFSNGPFGSDLLTSELQSEGVPVIYIRDIRNGVYKWKSNVFVTPEKAKSLANCQVLGEDVIIAKVGDPPGISAVYPEQEGLAIITQDVIRVRLNQNIILPTFFSFLLNSETGKQLIKKISIEGTRNRFPLGDFKKLKIEVPPIELQNQFAAIVLKTEALKEQYKSSLSELEALYGSLSQRAFKGELRFKKEDVVAGEQMSFA